MGFFSDLKEDLSQAVNELMPDEVKVNQEPPNSLEQKPADGAHVLEPAESLDEMLARVDTIQVSDELLAGQDDDKFQEDLGMEDEAIREEDKAILEEDGSIREEERAVWEEEKAIPGEEKAIWDEDIMQDNEDFFEGEQNLKAAELMTDETGHEFTDSLDSDNLSSYHIGQDADNLQVDKIIQDDLSMDLESMLESTFGTGNTASDKEQEESRGADKDMENSQSRVALDETAVITAGMTINGDISSEGSIDVIGCINGNIDALGKLNITGFINGNSKAAEIFADSAKITGEVVSEGAVKIGASSVIIGNITATSAVIAGAVKGDIDVRGPVVLDTSAIVMGNIKSKSVQINNGAVIEGMCSQCYAEVSPTTFFDDYKPDPSKKGNSAKGK